MTRQTIAYLAWHLTPERGHRKEHWIISHFPLLFMARVNCDFVVIKKQELVFCAYDEIWSFLLYFRISLLYWLDFLTAFS